jgi:hypothetical protein
MDFFVVVFFDGVTVCVFKSLLPYKALLCILKVIMRVFRSRLNDM